jgi:HK97 family phage major capsid protein
VRRWRQQAARLLTYAAGTTAGKINQLKTGVNGGFAATLPGNKLIDLVFSVKDKYRANAKFAMHRLTVAEVRKLVDGQGNYLWQRDFSVRSAAARCSATGSRS